ncbi:glycosyltransferase [Dongia deserti]|uniref:glycosyltransferase n=1 Tax=Dongia deserti TaxID=2268030 RepID=UPI0025495292|nr:glycosyltransferase [Dongia deserti]
MRRHHPALVSRLFSCSGESLTGLPLKIVAKIDKVDEEYWDSAIKPMVRSHPNVEFIGEVNDDQKADFFGNAPALVFPVDWPEPFGLVVIEAMACGTPVIAFRCGSIPEVIDEGVTGMIVETIDEAVEVASGWTQSIGKAFARPLTGALPSSGWPASMWRYMAACRACT